jgi:hypothetical protein
MYMYYLFVVKAAHACNANRRKHTPVRPHTHSKQDTNTHTLKHTHTRMHKAKHHTNTRGKHVLETQKTHTMTSFRKSDLQPSIASEGLMH